jgi:hypothetical protein
MESAASILSYRGNPDQGGFNGQGTPLIGSDKDYYGEFANMMRDVYNKNFEFNAQRYQQAVADRNAATDLFYKQQINHPLEDRDRPEVEAAYNKVKDVMLKYNGNPMSHPQGRIEALGAIQKFQQLKALAQSRNLEAADQRKAIANELDPETRQGMIQHLDDQLGQGIYKVPDPYYKKLDYKMENVLHNPGMEVVGKPEFVRDPSGVAYVKTVKATDPKKIIDYYALPNIMEGNNKTLPNEIGIFSDYLKKNPDFNEEKIVEVNNKLNDLNQKNGWGIGNPYYTEPIKYTKNDDGSLNVQDNNIDLAKKMALYAYGNHQQIEQLPSKEAQAAFKSIATETKEKQEGNAATMNAQTNRIKANTAEKTAQFVRQKLVEDTQLAKANKDNVELKTQMLKSDTFQPVKSIYDEAIKINNQKGFTPVISNPYFRTIIDSNPTALGDLVAHADNYEVKELSNSNPIISKMVATQGTSLDGKPTKMSDKPKSILIVRPKDGNVADFQIIGIGKDGQPTVMNLSEGAVNLLRVDNGFQSNDKVLERENAARGVMDMFLKGQENSSDEDNNDNNQSPASAPSSAAQNVPAGVYNVNGKPYHYDGKGAYHPVK